MKNYKNPYLRNLDTILSHEDDPKNPYLSHGWGKKPEQKAKEKEYNHKYYEAHKEKWGVGDHLKALGSSVKESLQKHNENWQSGMDTILKKNVTSQSSPSATVQKKKVNSASAMAANEKAKAEAAAKQYRQATAAQRRASVMAGSEQARANEAAKNYRKANASAERAKAEAASKKAAQDLQQFKSEQFKNKQKIDEMHAEFERIQAEAKRAKDKQAQSDYRDASMERTRDTTIVKRANNWKSKVDAAAENWAAQAQNYEMNANAALGMYNSLLPVDQGAATTYYNQYTAYVAAANEAKATYQMLLDESKRMDDLISSTNYNKNVMADYMKNPESYDVKNHSYNKKTSK